MGDNRPVVHFAIPGELEAATGGYAYDRALLDGLPGHGINIQHMMLPGGYPAPDADDLAETERLFTSVPQDHWLLVDGLALGAMPEAFVATRPQRLAALIHHPLALETGLSDQAAARLVTSERAALAHTDAVIVTSAETGNLLRSDYGVPSTKLTLARPGVERRDRARTDASDMPRLLTIGAISERKGYDILVEALTQTRDHAWTLDIIGDTDRAFHITWRLAQQIYRARLGDRIALLGEVTDAELDHLFRDSDLFVLPSRFEGYGMVVTEAIAYGLPVVATDQVPAALELPSEAVVIVPAEDAANLGQVLRDLILNPAARRAMADAAWAHARALPRWDETCATVARVFMEGGS